MGESVSVGPAQSVLVEARAALERHQWQASFDAFGRAGAVAETPLSGDDLEAYALAAYFSAQPAVVMDARERADKAHLAAGDKDRAATAALIPSSRRSATKPGRHRCAVMTTSFDPASPVPEASS